MDTIGAIDRLEIEAGGFIFTGRACGPHEGRPALLLHGFPQTSWAWRDELWALGAGRLSGHRTGPARVLLAAPGPPDVGTTPPNSSSATCSRWPTPCTWRRSTWWATTGAACSAWITAARQPGRVRSLGVVSTPHPLALQDALLSGRPRPGRTRGGDRFLPHPRPARAAPPRCRRLRRRVGDAVRRDGAR